MAALYCTATELRAEIDLTSTSDDATLERLIEAASRNIDRACNRPDGFKADTVASARYYTGDGSAVQLIDECVEVTAVAVKDSATDTTYTAWDSPTTNMAGDGDWLAFTGDKKWPEFNRLPYTAIAVDLNGDYSVFTCGAFAGKRGFPMDSDTRRNVPTVSVTARWGYSDNTPADIKMATIMQCGRWYKQVQGAMADGVANADFGQLVYRQVLHPDIKRLLVDGRYIRPMTWGRR